MSPEEAVRVLKQNVQALRRISVRRSVQLDDESDLRQVAANLDELAIELSATKGK